MDTNPLEKLNKTAIVDAMTSDKAVLSILLIDDSGSMGLIADPAEESFQGYQQGIIQADTDQPDISYYMGMVSFGEHTEVISPVARAQKVKPLTGYNPRQPQTRVYEATFAVLEYLMRIFRSIPDNQKAENFRLVLIVFTDGRDMNSDKDKFPHNLQSMALLAIQTGWELGIRAIGRIVESKQLARDMGFPQKFAENVAHNAEGMHTATQSAIGMTTRFGRGHLN